MAADHIHCAWWHKPPPAMTPLDALRIATDHLERGIAVPEPAAGVVARALRKYLNGHNDITRNLGLRPGKGVRHGAARERKADRDLHIKIIFERLPGKRTARAKAISSWLATPPKIGEVTEADIFAHLMQLHRAHGSDLPKSWEQILKVVPKGS